MVGQKERESMKAAVDPLYHWGSNGGFVRRDLGRGGRNEYRGED